MGLAVITIALLSRAAPVPDSCPVDFLDLAERIGRHIAEYPEFEDFSAGEAFKPRGVPSSSWPTITFERGVDRVKVRHGRRVREKLVMHGRYPIAFDVTFIFPEDIELVSTTPDGGILGWYYKVSLDTRGKTRSDELYWHVRTLLRSYERRCGGPERAEGDAGE